MRSRFIRAAGPRHHVEAFPRLDLREARKQVMSRFVSVLWRDQRGHVWGTGSVEMDRNRLTLSAGFLAMPGVAARVKQDEFLLELVGRGSGATDVLTKCSGCGNNVRIVVLKNSTWLCRSCQGLVYRSTMIGEVGRQTERLDELDDLVGDGRPKGMHEVTFQNYRKERALLRVLLGDGRVTPSRDYSEVVTTFWQEEGPPLRFDGEPYVGGSLQPK